MESEKLNFIIERFDKNIEIADTKANIILTVCSGLLAIILFKSVPDILNGTNHILRNIIIFCLGVSVLCIGYAIVEALRCINPRIPKSVGEKSIFYFMDIEEIETSEIRNRLENDILNEQIEQAKVLARICSEKMKCIKRAYVGLGIGLASIGMLALVNIFTL